MGSGYLNSHPFISATVTGSVVCAVALLLLICLLVKGYQTKTMHGYFLIYLLLLNMAMVWACQIPLNWLKLDIIGPCPTTYDPPCYVINEIT